MAKPANDKLELAKLSWETGDYKGALKLLKEVEKEYRGTMIAAEAKRMYQAVYKDYAASRKNR